MIDFVIILVIVAVLGLSVLHIYRQKKKGNPCIGCPNGSDCGGSCHCKEE